MIAVMWSCIGPVTASLSDRIFELNIRKEDVCNSRIRSDSDKMIPINSFALSVILKQFPALSELDFKLQIY